jgi:hypothetical protein
MPSTTARPMRRNWAGRVAVSCIAADHRRWRRAVNPILGDRAIGTYISGERRGRV